MTSYVGMVHNAFSEGDDVKIRVMDPALFSLSNEKNESPSKCLSRICFPAKFNVLALKKGKVKGCTSINFLPLFLPLIDNFIVILGL